MATDLVLRVQYGEDRPATSPQPQQLNTQLSGATRNISLKNIASTAVVANMARNISNQLLGNIGSLTGDQNTQDTINDAQTILNIGIGFAVNPAIGFANVAGIATTEIIRRVGERRKNNINADFNRKLSGNTMDGSR